MPDLGSLTTGELSTTTTALAWLVNMRDRGILEADGHSEAVISHGRLPRGTREPSTSRASRAQAGRGCAPGKREGLEPVARRQAKVRVPRALAA